jgi:uncharacterized protein YbjT (DUF2867 family)
MWLSGNQSRTDRKLNVGDSIRMKKAILFGASGFIGAYLLEELLANSEYGQVTVVVRTPLPQSHQKLKMLIGDFRTLQSLGSELIADDVFITLGTTKKHTPLREEYYRIDHDYPVLAAKSAKANGAKSIFIVTAIGANADSNFFYVKTKGETERDITALNFQHTHIFQPSMIMGHRKEKRAMEKMLINIWSIIDPLFVGSLSRYKGIDGKDVAKAMINAARIQTDKVKIYQWRAMSALLSGSPPN